MAFTHTTAQILDRSKTITRRVGWRFLRPGDLLQAVDRNRGLGSGEHPRLLAVLRIVSVRVEPLSRLKDDPRYAEDELPREGFPCWTRDEFLDTFCRTHGLASLSHEVTRIEFEYVNSAETR
jgi:hypothetical protein